MKGPAYTWINSRKCLAIEYMKPIAALLLIALLFLSFDSLADVPAEQKAEAEYLINYLQESDCRMVRNGKSYNNSFAEAQLMHSNAVGSTSRRAGAMSSPHSWQ